MIGKSVLLCMVMYVVVAVAWIDPPDFAPPRVSNDQQKRSTSIDYILYCIDQRTSCSYWAANGECTVNPIYMNLNCQDSCQVCHDGDKSLYCGYWARRGECTKNPSYMNNNCAPSCAKYAKRKRSAANSNPLKRFNDVIARKA